MSEAESKIPFTTIQAMLAKQLRVDPEKINPDTILSTLGSKADISRDVRSGVVGLMGKYFEARSDEVDGLFGSVATQSVHPLSQLRLTLSAGTVHQMANALYEFLDEHN
jgi:hypothetical protein